MKHHIQNLDGLRGLAALSVVISHASKAGYLPEIIFGHALGEYGVMLFFALSGFLISYLYLEQNFTRTQIGDYAVSRFARVYPLFAFVVLLHWLLFISGINNMQTDPPYIAIDTQDLFLHLVFLKGENIFWTISPEFQFYAFFILLWFLHARSKNTYTLAVTICLLFILNTMIAYDSSKTPLLYGLNFFLAGILAGYIYTRHGETMKARTRGAEFYFLTLLFILSLPPLYRIIFETQQLKFLSPANALIAGGIVFYAALGARSVNIILSSKPLRWLGVISFSLYLFHMPVLSFFSSLNLQMPTLISFVIYFALILIISALSYYLIERPARFGLKKALLR